MEELTFKSLLLKFRFDEILSEVKTLCQRLRPDLFEQTDWGIYQNAYQDLQTRKAVKSKYAIQIVERWDKLSLSGSNCCLYYDEDGDYDYREIGSYPSKDEIVGMKIIVNDNVALTLQELAAGLLWEITYIKRNGLGDIDINCLTFKYLLMRFSFDEILDDFKRLYKRNAPESYQATDWDIYRKVYQALQTHEASESQHSIYLVSRWENCSPLIDMNCSVYDTGRDEVQCPMATYSPWSEILGMNIIVECDVIITPQELTAGLLWEITYYGKIEKTVQEHLKTIFK